MGNVLFGKKLVIKENHANAYHLILSLIFKDEILNSYLYKCAMYHIRSICYTNIYHLY